MSTNISWTDETWNPVIGCTKVSEGCENCYAERMAFRLCNMSACKYREVIHGGDPLYDKDAGHWNGKVYCDETALDKPLHWRKPRRIFVCSMGDLFHKDVPYTFFTDVMVVCEKCKQHQFQILTKRPERMAQVFQDMAPPPNVHLGWTAENQKMLDLRTPIGLQIPTAKRFVSLEPLLEPIDINQDYYSGRFWGDMLDQVIIGCESMPGGRAGRFQDGFVKAAKDIVRQCKAAGVKVHVKQIPVNGKVSHKMSEWPEALRVQEMI